MRTIAAIIPLYNGRPFIREALDSVLAQGRPADEIIVVDDGSTDEGHEIVEALRKNDKRIRLLRKSNGGQGSARNLGVASTSCDLIAFLDQDDYWYKDHLSALEQLFESKDDGKLAYVYSNPDRVGVDGEMLTPKLLNTLKNQEHPKTSLMSCLAKDMCVLPGSSLISRKIFLEVGGFDEQFRGYEDDDLFVRMFCAGYRAEYIDRALYAWRNNPSSTSYSLAMIISRENYFSKLSKTALIEKLPNRERSIFAHRFARLAYRDMKFAIKRRDQTLADRLLAQVMNTTSRMTPYSRFLLRFKVLRRYWLFRARTGMESMLGIKRDSRTLAASIE